MKVLPGFFGPGWVNWPTSPCNESALSQPVAWQGGPVTLSVGPHTQPEVFGPECLVRPSSISVGSQWHGSVACDAVGGACSAVMMSLRAPRGIPLALHFLAGLWEYGRPVHRGLVMLCSPITLTACGCNRVHLLCAMLPGSSCHRASCGAVLVLCGWLWGSQQWLLLVIVVWSVVVVVDVVVV